MSNIRSLYAEVVAAGLVDPGTGHSGSVIMKQQVDGWATSGDIAGVDVASLNSLAKKDATVQVVWVPASGANDAYVTIGGVTAKINNGVS